MYYLQSRYYDPAICRFINADDFVSTGKDFIGYNMFTYCNNSPIEHCDSSGEILIGAMIGGAIGGGLISVVSHITTNSNATVGSTLVALAIGAGTGALGGWAGIPNAPKAVISIAAGAIAGIYSGFSTSGSFTQKVTTGIATGVIAAVGTYCGTKFDTIGVDRFATAVANYSTTILVGSFTEPIAVAAQQHIADTSEKKSVRQTRTSIQQRKWDLFRKKEERLLLSRY